MKIALCSIVTAVGIFGAQCTLAQQLWQGAEAGMTVAEVQRQFPDAQAKPNAAADTRSGVLEALHLPNIDVGGLRFDVGFGFKDQKLTQVRLFTHDVHTAADTQYRFRQMSEALRSKYGPELSHDPGSRSSLGSIYSSTWAAGKTSISLVGAFYGDPGLINILYSLRISAAADKL